MQHLIAFFLIVRLVACASINERFLHALQVVKKPDHRLLSEMCGSYKGEFHLVYDISGSYADDLKTLRRIAPSLFSGLEAEFPGSRFGVGVYSDKAKYPMGRSGDVCYATRLSMTANIPSVLDVINSVTTLNGGDYPESQLDALYHGVMDNAVGWSDWRHDGPDDHVIRFLILATDAKYHVPGGSGLPAHDGRHSPACLKLDYPSIAMIREALLAKKVVPLFLITEHEDHYRQLLSQLGVGGSVQTLKSDSSNAIEAITSGLKEITCATTTAAPTTAAPTTAAPTTAAPTTAAPTTAAPTTEAPTTEAPTTEAPTTEAPTTEAPPTEAPPTEAPPTEAPPTEAPPTEAPPTEAPTTEATDDDKSSGTGVVVGAAMGGAAGLAAAVGGGLYAYGTVGASPAGALNAEVQGQGDAQDRDMAAEVDFSAYA